MSNPDFWGNALAGLGGLLGGLLPIITLWLQRREKKRKDEANLRIIKPSSFTKHPKRPLWHKFIVPIVIAFALLGSVVGFLVGQRISEPPDPSPPIAELPTPTRVVSTPPLATVDPTETVPPSLTVSVTDQSTPASPTTPNATDEVASATQESSPTAQITETADSNNTPPKTPIVTAPQTDPLQTPTLTRTPTSTSMPVSPTPTSTSTSTPVSTPTPTSTATPSPIPTSTPVSLPPTPVLPTNGIAFSTENNGQYDIYVKDPNSPTIPPYQLTNDSAEDKHPTWSPDRKMIAFASRRDHGDECTSNNFEIYVMSVDDPEKQERLTCHGDIGNGNAENPSWSPRGDKIAYVASNNGNIDIYVVDIVRGESTRLTNHVAADTHPTWSVDGEWIAFQSQRDNGRWTIHKVKVNDNPDLDNSADLAVPVTSTSTAQF